MGKKGLQGLSLQIRSSRKWYDWKSHAEYKNRGRLNKEDGTLVIGGCFYFSFHRKWSKFGFRGRLGPKNTDAEKHASIMQVLTFWHAKARVRILRIESCSCLFLLIILIIIRNEEYTGLYIYRVRGVL